MHSTAFTVQMHIEKAKNNFIKNNKITWLMKMKLPLLTITYQSRKTT